MKTTGLFSTGTCLAKIGGYFITIIRDHLKVWYNGVSLFTTQAAILFRIGTFDSNLSEPLFTRALVVYTTIILVSHRVSTFVSRIHSVFVFFSRGTYFSLVFRENQIGMTCYDVGQLNFFTVQKKKKDDAGVFKKIIKKRRDFGH